MVRRFLAPRVGAMAMALAAVRVRPLKTFVVVGTTATLAVATVMVLPGVTAGSAQTNPDPCFLGPPALVWHKLRPTSKTTSGETGRAFRATVDLSSVRYDPSTGNFVNYCTAEMEMVDGSGTVHNFRYPSTNGTSTAHRLTFTAADQCRVARVQKEMGLSSAKRKTECVTTLLTVNISSVYAHAHREVEDHGCTALGQIVSKSSSAAHAKRETETVNVSARMNPSSPSDTKSGEGTLNLQVARAKRDQLRVMVLGTSREAEKPV